jgi:hypothetical protein
MHEFRFAVYYFDGALMTGTCTVSTTGAFGFVYDDGFTL